jgi:uncharacterized protein YcfJ
MFDVLHYHFDGSSVPIVNATIGLALLGRQDCNQRHPSGHCAHPTQSKEMSTDEDNVLIAQTRHRTLAKIASRTPVEGKSMMMTRTSIAFAAAAAALGASGAANATEYARVVSARPVTESVSVPRQECVSSQQIVQQQPSGGGAVVGALVGGVLGNQFGHGFGKAVATGAGAVAGAAVGNSVEVGANPPVAVPTQQCRTVSGQESRIVAYDVVYEYHGQRYSTRLPEDPGPRLAVDVRPAGNAAVEPSAPAQYGAVPPAQYGAVPPAYADTAPIVNSPPLPVTYASPPPAYYYPAPAVYPAYSPYYYAAPVIGFGLGYWAGSAWHGGRYYGGWHGHWH